MPPITTPLNASHGAHALREFRDRGKGYLPGESYPTAGLSQFKLDGLIAARLIAYGPPSESLARKLAARLAAEAEAKLEAETAPATPTKPPKIDQRQQLARR